MEVASEARERRHQLLEGSLEKAPFHLLEGSLEKAPGQHLEGSLKKAPGKHLEGSLKKASGEDLEGVHRLLASAKLTSLRFQPSAASLSPQKQAYKTMFLLELSKDLEDSSNIG